MKWISWDIYERFRFVLYDLLRTICGVDSYEQMVALYRSHFACSAGFSLYSVQGHSIVWTVRCRRAVLFCVERFRMTFWASIERFQSSNVLVFVSHFVWTFRFVVERFRCRRLCSASVGCTICSYDMNDSLSNNFVSYVPYGAIWLQCSRIFVVEPNKIRGDGRTVWRTDKGLILEPGCDTSLEPNRAPRTSFLYR